MQENYNWNQGQPTPPPYSPYGAPPPERKGYAIASLVLGILSLVLCCVGGGILGIVGLILGIVSLVKKESKLGMAIAGIITSSFGIVFGIVMLIYVVMFAGFFSEHYEDILSGAVVENVPEESVLGEDRPIRGENDIEMETESAVDIDTENPFIGSSFAAEDGSVIYFAEDGTFIRYLDDANWEDNYYTGTYDCYRAEFAESYIAAYMGEYGVTEDEFAEIFRKNAKLYEDEDFICLVLHNTSAVIDKEDQIKEPYDTNYMGFYLNDCYEATDMSSGETMVLTEKDM